jgi:hypothetical protein
MVTSRLFLTLTSLTLVLFAAACSKSEPASDSVAQAPTPTPTTAVPQQAAAEGIKPLTQKKFGQPVTETKTTALPELVKDASKFSEQTVRTEGVVSNVCKSMGCWMEIADSSGQAHIKMAGHAFFVPRDCAGHRAVVQGKVMPANAEKTTCGDNDGCGQGKSAEMAKVEIEATGIEFID